MANIPSYQRRANGTEKFEYLTPDYEKFTKDTFGILVYQEQVMQLAQVLAGYTKGESDVLRKAIGKKKVEVLAKALGELKTRLIDYGQSEEVADKICKEIEPFAGYGFNRSHAAAYAFVACQTAYFKAHYPIEFFTSLLTVNADRTDKVKIYMEDAKRHGITLLPPDINKSKVEFTIESDTEIRMGLSSVKGLGAAVLEPLVLNQPYDGLADFALKAGPESIKKQNIETLALGGMFDSFYPEKMNRMEILSDAFICKGDAKNATAALENVKMYKNPIALEKEREILGFYLTGHPLEGIGQEVDLDIGMETTIKGKASVSDIREIMTKNKDPMAFVTLSFLNESENAVIFPTTYVEEFTIRGQRKTLRDLLCVGLIVDVAAKYTYNLQRDEISFIVNKMTVPLRVNESRLNELLGE